MNIQEVEFIFRKIKETENNLKSRYQDSFIYKNNVFKRTIAHYPFNGNKSFQNNHNNYKSGYYYQQGSKKVYQKIRKIKFYIVIITSNLDMIQMTVIN